MDEARVEALGSTPLEPALAALTKVKDRRGLAAWLAEQHLAATSSELLFAFGSQQDATDATQFIAAAWAGGLGLPDRDDSLDQDPRSKEVRERYREPVVPTLQLLGDDAATAKRTNPHSPPKYRVNGLVVNMPEFSRAFGCKPGQPMTKPTEKVCKVW